MKKLDRKLLRDTVRIRGQAIAIAAVVAAGVATFVAMNGAYEAVRRAQSSYYATHRFADVFASVKRMPSTILDRIAAIPGVVTVNGRVVADVSLDVPGLDEPAAARLVSIPNRADVLNRVYIRQGRMIDAKRDDEVIASEQFCAANGLRIGDRLRAVINSRWKELRIVGIGNSPEYINEVGSASTFPDHKRFGVLWMGHDGLAAAYAMQGAVNDITVSLARGADERDVIAEMDRLLLPYGGIGAYGRDDQLSHRFIRDEIKQDRVTAEVMPSVFALVAAFLLHMVLARLVAGQRDQIAILKAFGYRNAPIVAHFVKFAVAIVLAGSAVGIALGILLGTGLAGMYRRFFSFPDLRFVTTAASMIMVPVAGAGVAVLATLFAVSRAVAISPAEGMRGEQPPRFQTTRLDRVLTYLSSAGRMVVRSIARRPVRASLSIVAIALSVMILMGGRFVFDALDNIIDIQFRAAQRDDVTVTFTQPRAKSVEHDLRRLPGVRDVETFRMTAARARFEYRSRRVPLIGLPRRSAMQRLIDVDGRETPVPPDGVVLSSKLARILGASRGSVVDFETLEGRRTTIRLSVVDTFDELLGINAYVDRDLLARLLDDSGAVSGAHLSVDPAAARMLNRVLKQQPAIGSSAFREIMLRSFRQTVVENLRISTTAIIFFACVITFGVIYNNARIALSERGRDLASLRVLGFTHREVGALLLSEQALLTALAIPVGFLFGRLMALWFVHLFDTEGYRMTPTVSGDTYAFAFAILAAATIVSGAAVWRRIRRLDLIEALKTRE